ncbi:MAG TPA: AMP-binding protein, partial [Acidimicrobiales bacterium]
MAHDDAQGSQRTMAELAAGTAARVGDQVAMRHLVDGAWVDVSYTELAGRVSAQAAGLVAFGLEPGDRVCILADTSPAWTELGLAVASVGGVVVPIYPSNSPDECAWVIGNSGARIVACENAAQVAKVDAVQADLPGLELTVVIVGDAAGATPLTELVARGSSVDAQVLVDRRAAVAPGDPYTIIYTSGTTGRPKGCVLSHAGFGLARQVTQELELIRGDDVVYLYLPLAHVFAQLVQACVIESGGSIAYFGGDTKRIVAELAEVQPTALPSVPRIFEKIYAMAVGMVSEADRPAFDAAVDQCVEVRLADAQGHDVAPELRAAAEAADAQLFAPLRSLFGGKLRLAISGAAPI